MEKKISVRFNGTGVIEAETEGFKGAACQETMDQLLGNLGATVSTSVTDDYYESPDDQQETESQSG